jgi:hypothetical protein
VEVPPVALIDPPVELDLPPVPEPAPPLPPCSPGELLGVSSELHAEKSASAAISVDPVICAALRVMSISLLLQPTLRGSRASLRQWPGLSAERSRLKVKSLLAAMRSLPERVRECPRADTRQHGLSAFPGSEDPSSMILSGRTVPRVGNRARVSGSRELRHLSAQRQLRRRSQRSLALSAGKVRVLEKIGFRVVYIS